MIEPNLAVCLQCRAQHSNHTITTKEKRWKTTPRLCMEFAWCAVRFLLKSNSMHDLHLCVHACMKISKITRGYCHLMKNRLLPLMIKQSHVNIHSEEYYFDEEIPGHLNVRHRDNYCLIFRYLQMSFDWNIEHFTCPHTNNLNNLKWLSVW